MKFHIKESDNILIVSPHPDDETIGCGGIMLMYGDKIDVLLMTDGKAGISSSFSDYKNIVSVRRDEFEKVMKIANIRAYFFLDMPDGNLGKIHNGLSKIDFSIYQYIFVPNKWETHIDHKATYKLITKLKCRQKFKARIIQYEVWTSLRNPCIFVDISKQIEIKKMMISQYKSQLADTDYINTTLGLNKYRGIYKNYKYAEAYTLDGFWYFVWVLYEKFPINMKKAIKRWIKNDE